MKRNRHGPTVTDGLMFGHEEVAVMDLFTPRSALSGTPLVFQSAKLLDHVQDAIDFVIPWQPVFRRQWKRSASLRVPHPEHFHARVLPPVLEENNLQAGCDRVLADGTWNSTLLLPRAEGNRSGVPRDIRTSCINIPPLINDGALSDGNAKRQARVPARSRLAVN